MLILTPTGIPSFEPRPWYRNAGSKQHHRASENWIQSGLAECGEDITHPGFTITEKHRHTVKTCSKCERSMKGTK